MGFVKDGVKPETSPSDMDVWLMGQRHALEAALENAPLEISLGVLVRTAQEWLGPKTRAAFFVASQDRTVLRHVVGMPADYTEAEHGFEIGPKSLGCGLSTHTGQPIFTPDVEKEPLWKPWRWMAKKFGFRSCWSFPISSSGGEFIGTFAMYWPEPREEMPKAKDLAAIFTQTAGIIIARHHDAELQRQTETALRQSQEQLESELSDSRLLHSISVELAREGDVDTLYEKVTDAAMTIMRSQFGTIQQFHPDRGNNGELKLLASRGFDPEDIKFWNWVRADSGCTCGEVLRTKRRAVAEDIETCQYMQGTPDRQALLNTGMRAAQSTPLFSRFGVLVGMISTHWTQPHQPAERQLRLLDILARQAADLIERTKSEDALRKSETRFRELVEQTPDGIFLTDANGRYIDVNPAGCELLGLTREEILSSALPDMIVPEQKHRIPEEVARFDAGTIVRSEWCMLRKDGTRFEAEIVSRRLPNGDLQGIVRDVSELRCREAALRESEERFRMLADNISQLAWTCKELGNVDWYNKRWLDYTGLTFEELKDWGWMSCQHPDHVDRVVASVTRSRETGEVWEDTFPLRGKDGQYCWFLSYAYPIKDEDGRVIRWFGTNTDITERKKAEDTQRLLLNELNHRVKNTLAIVQAIAQRTAAGTHDPAEFAKNFSGRIQSLSRVHTILSDSSWHGAGLHELINDQLLAGAVDETKLTVKGPAIQLDPQMALHVALILHELGTNSNKYGALSVPEGNVSVSWSADEMLNIRWVERGGPPVEAPAKCGFGTKLIEQCADGQEGTARILYEKSGVIAEIQLPLNANTAFSVAPDVSILPSVNSAPSVANFPTASIAGCRFLVIEDEPLIGLDLVSALEDAEALVEGPVGTIEKALELINGAPPDGALLDANLHGKPVDAVAQALAQRNVPFMFVTGHGRDGLPEAFRDATVLRKPFNHAQIVKSAAQLVAKTPNATGLKA